MTRLVAFILLAASALVLIVAALAAGERRAMRWARVTGDEDD